MRKLALLLVFMFIANTNLFAKELTFPLEIKDIIAKGNVNCEIDEKGSAFTTVLDVKKIGKNRPKVTFLNNSKIKNIKARRKGRKIIVKYIAENEGVVSKYVLSFNKRGEKPKLREVVKGVSGRCVFKFGPIA